MWNKHDIYNDFPFDFVDYGSDDERDIYKFVNKLINSPIAVEYSELILELINNLDVETIGRCLPFVWKGACECRFPKVRDQSKKKSATTRYKCLNCGAEFDEKPLRRWYSKQRTYVMEHAAFDQRQIWAKQLNKSVVKQSPYYKEKMEELLEYYGWK